MVINRIKSPWDSIESTFCIYFILKSRLHNKIFILFYILSQYAKLVYPIQNAKGNNIVGAFFTF